MCSGGLGEITELLGSTTFSRQKVLPSLLVLMALGIMSKLACTAFSERVLPWRSTTVLPPFVVATTLSSWSPVTRRVQIADV